MFSFGNIHIFSNFSIIYSWLAHYLSFHFPNFKSLSYLFPFILLPPFSKSLLVFFFFYLLFPFFPIFSFLFICYIVLPPLLNPFSFSLFFFNFHFFWFSLSSRPSRCTFEYLNWSNLCGPSLYCTANLQLLKRKIFVSLSHSYLSPPLLFQIPSRFLFYFIFFWYISFRVIPLSNPFLSFIFFSIFLIFFFLSLSYLFTPFPIPSS